jgi:hypothetical protein
MAKGSFITPFLLGSKSNCSTATQDDQAQANANRMSTSSRFPSLRRLETSHSDTSGSSSARPSSMGSKPTSRALNGLDVLGSSSGSSGSSALLTLKFTGPSYLDVVAKDHATKEPIYIIETVRDSTTIYRLERRTREAVKAACVQWPSSLIKGKTTGRTVQMGNGRWRDTEDFLKFGTLATYA